MKSAIASIFVTLLFCRFVGSSVYAQECDSSCSNAIECRDKIAKCQNAWDQMETAKQPHVDALRKMESDIAAFQNRIKMIEGDVVKKAAAIAENETELGGLLATVGKRARKFYIRSIWTNPMVTFFSTTNIGSVLRMLVYQQSVINEDKKAITQTALSIKDLEERKRSLEKERFSLAYLKEETDKRAVSVRKLVNDASAYQSKLTGIIASLTAQQQTILNARSGTFTTSVGDVPLADDPNASPAYNPGFSPAFAGFSFGAYTHKKGMSQYGAKGRAESGQNSGQILQAYFGKTPVGKDTGGTISVSGFGNLDFENQYLMGIAEMPSTFPKEALKAQAIAARTYAYRYKTSGQTICTTQSCQVFSKSKADSPPGEWKSAVEETRGQVLEDTVGYYSSTTGGYITTMGWDTKCGNQGCWTGDAYEKIANSPWFYKGWYTESYLNSSAKCGRSHPWLTGEEFADILNAWQVRKNGGDASRILPVTINSCPIGGASGNPYSMSELRDQGGYSSVSSVSVTYNSGGYTDTVTLGTNKGTVQISGSEFKEAFNLRAPGYISIRSSLFNIEKK
ncbi:MAG: SpoIID/LytB domain protein [Candidatus Curtissbacteria bacterium GW2011_GWA1_41_11]|uniref:SpoIID/LytB domain protein n=1 Tax=Candidatus Curtissbacteria bacterium GW2011_GWA1_41_11 TaxID=1618409 RepID=A0A0G0UBT7_9BACT|nr:MAG: SpoIID/LytB domain protein [Candidatus Curtissbacteria bacterium GW2011_GWA1_41_11]